MDNSDMPTRRIYVIWLVLVALLGSCAPRPPEVTAVSEPARTDAATPEGTKATADDLAILDRADSLLADPDHWEQSANPYGCEMQEKRFSLFCALLIASEDVIGAYEHRRPALEEVRQAIEQAAQGKSYARRLLDFNADPEVSFQQIKMVIENARGAIRERLGQ